MPNFITPDEVIVYLSHRLEMLTEQARSDMETIRTLRDENPKLRTAVETHCRTLAEWGSEIETLRAENAELRAQVSLLTTTRTPPSERTIPRETP